MRLAFAYDMRAFVPASRAIKPIVPLDQAARPKQAHRRIPSERQWTAHVIDAAKFEGFPLNSTGPRDAITRVHRESSRDILHLSEDAAERARVLDGLGGALRKERDHRVSRVADKRDAPERK